MARIVSRIYAAAGVLASGHIVETSRAGLVAGYVGQTAIKTEDVFRRALGGTLFIDEAYSLRRSGRDQEDFGLEAIDTLVKLMEDHRDEVVVIVAGYPEEMAEFVSSNPGLESRFKRIIHFPDYTDPELVEIFAKLCRDSRLLLTPDAVRHLGELIAALPRGRDFANGRTIRRMFEHAVARQADRLAATRSDLAVEDLVILEPADLPPVDLLTGTASRSASDAHD